MCRRRTPPSAISFWKTPSRRGRGPHQGGLGEAAGGHRRWRRGAFMTKTIKVALAGAGAFGLKHLDAIKLIDGVEVISLVGRELDKTQEAAEKYGVAHATTELSETLEAPRPRRGDPRDADPDARRADDRVPRGRQARAGRDPARRQPEGRRSGGRGAKEDRARRDGRPYAPLQSRAISSSTSASSPTNSISSRWTCRPISSAAPT